jgi:hypothetical protein
MFQRYGKSQNLHADRKTVHDWVLRSWFRPEETIRVRFCHFERSEAESRNLAMNWACRPSRPDCRSGLSAALRVCDLKRATSRFGEPNLPGSGVQPAAEMTGGENRPQATNKCRRHRLGVPVPGNSCILTSRIVRFWCWGGG